MKKGYAASRRLERVDEVQGANRSVSTLDECVRERSNRHKKASLIVRDYLFMLTRMQERGIPRQLP